MDHWFDLFLLVEGIEFLLGFPDEIRVVHHVITPEQADHGNILQQDPVCCQFRDRSPGKTDDQQTALPGDAFGASFKHFSANGIVDHISPAAPGPFFHCFDKIIPAVVENLIGTTLPADFQFLFRARGSQDAGSQSLANLNGGRAHSTGAPVYEQGFSGFD